MSLPIGSNLPMLDGATQWLAGDSEKVITCGSPLFVQFWTLSCPICRANMPRVLQIIHTYWPCGVHFLSVHVPRDPQDREAGRVRAASEEMGLTGWSLLDNEHVLGERFRIANVWPFYFFFGAEHRLRSRGAGRIGLAMTENSLKRLLNTSQQDLLLPIASDCFGI